MQKVGHFVTYLTYQCALFALLAWCETPLCLPLQFRNRIFTVKLNRHQLRSMQNLWALSQNGRGGTLFLHFFYTFFCDIH